MKILIIYPSLTHPIDAGNKQWVMAQVAELKKLGHDVFMLCLNIPGVRADMNQNAKEKTETKSFWGDYGFIYDASYMLRLKYTLLMLYRKIFNNGYYKCDDLYPAGLTRYVRNLNDKYHFDACIVNYYWLTKVLDGLDIPKKALNTHDVFAFKDMVVNAKNPWMATTADEEAKGVQRAQYAFALQDGECAYYERIAPKTKVLNVYCPYEIKKLDLTYNHNLVILSSSNRLNIEGFEWFCKDVYPSLIEQFPDINLIVGGYICKKIKAYANKPHITLIGAVDDPADLYKLGDIAINPCINGTGLKIKTFEAMSYGRVSMTHPHSTIGIFRKNDAPVFNSVDPKDWIDFLNCVWGDKNEIIDKQKQTISYIEDMNIYISERYAEFLKK